MTNHFIAVDKEGNKLFRCKVCGQYKKEKEYLKEIRTCEGCIDPFIEEIDEDYD